MRAGLFALLAALVASAAPARVLVDSRNTHGPFDGRSWATAFAHLQDGLDAAARQRDEVWVAEGTYTPLWPDGHDNCFVMREGVAVYGGFAGDESERGARQAETHPTLLSGDPTHERRALARHVLFGADGATLDGFTISDGYGGGMGNLGCSPTVRACRFQHNVAPRGGGVYNTDGARPRFESCQFVGNWAQQCGGAVCDDNGSAAVFSACLFIENSATRGGALADVAGASARLEQCLFRENAAELVGGALYNEAGSSATLVACLLSENRCEDGGGAVRNGVYPAGHPNRARLEHCLLRDDRAARGPNEISDWHDSRTDLVDCTLEADAPAERGNEAPPPAPPPPSRLEGGPVWFVNAFAHGETRDGRAWATAFRSLQPALAAAHGGERIWVAQGTYRPTDGEDRAAAFVLRPDVALFGGFAGGETRLEQRDPSAHRTTLSGVLASGRCYHVVIGADRALLDGLEITGADGAAHGGGMLNLGVSPTLRGLTFDDNRADLGGALYNADGASPTVIDCRFSDNRAIEGGAVCCYHRAAGRWEGCAFDRNEADNGGAMVVRDGSDPQIAGASFTANRARWRGGAVLVEYGSSPAFQGCRFETNRVTQDGGALFVDDLESCHGATLPRLLDCVFLANVAGGSGGALFAHNHCQPYVADARYADNRANGGQADLAADRGSWIDYPR